MRWLLFILGIAAAALVALPSAPFLQPFFWGGSTDWAFGAANVLLSLAAWLAVGVAFAILWRLPDHPAALPLAAFLVLAALAFGTLSAAAVGAISDAPALAARGGLVLVALALLAAAEAWLRFSRSFPRVLGPDELARAPTAPSASGRASRIERHLLGFDEGTRSSAVFSAIRRWRWIILPLALAGVIAGIIWLPPEAARVVTFGCSLLFVASFWPDIGGRRKPRPPASRLGYVRVLLGLAVLTIPVAFAAEGEAAIIPVAFAWLYFAACLILGAINLSHVYCLVGPAERRQLLWIAVGAVLWVVAFAYPLLPVDIVADMYEPAGGWTVNPGGIIYIGFALGALAFLACLAIGVFMEGALDPALVVRKATLYGILGAVVVFLVAGIEDLLMNWLAARLGISDHAGLWITAGVVALVI